MEHDGPDPLMTGIASSTGRVGHINQMQIDILSKTYATEVKNVKLPARFLAFWDKITLRAHERGKEPLLVIEPSNVEVGLRKHVQHLHMISAERHAELLEAEKQVGLLEIALNECEIRNEQG
jgi:hypothetical protein